MDTRLYKKRDLKFTNNEVSRNSRHAETLKARESSRFKRLSMLRTLDEETVKQEEKKKPLSRLEMLYKWKQEKEIKKELDKKNIKRPFYVGGQTGKSDSKMVLPSIAQTSIRFHSSRIAKSKLAPPTSSTQPAKVGNTSKQQTSGTSFQPSRIPNNFKLASHQRTAQSNNKYLDTKSAPNTRNGIKMNGKSLTVKSQAPPTSSTLPAKVGNASKQVSSLPKPNIANQPAKSVSKIGIPTFSSKGNSAQKINQKSFTVPATKLQGQVGPHLTDVCNKKKESNFKAAPNDLPGVKKGASSSSVKKKVEEKNKNTKIHKEEVLPKQALEKDSSIFDCNISIIKQCPSFAPPNFQFMPPAGLPDFTLDNEGINVKVISRTSTPSKPCKESSSPIVEVPSCTDSPSIDNLNSIPKNPLDPYPLEFDLKEAEEIIIKYKKLIEEEKEMNTSNDDLFNITEDEKQEACIDSPFNIVDLTKKELCTDLVQSIKQKDGLISEDEKQEACIDSPFNIVDLTEKELCTDLVQSMKQKDDDLINQHDQDKCSEKKSFGALSKRASMLKNVPVLNSIAETDENTEPDEYTDQTLYKNKQNSVINSRCSQKHLKLPMGEDPSCTTAVTPRRSLRLQKKVLQNCQFEETETFSPKSKSNLRRSIRLIDLNTPDKEITDSPVGKTNITVDFEKLSLKEPENINPQVCLLDFECSPVRKQKPKKISLLYSPEKVRKSLRKSIRGDLMSFSPSN